MNIVSKLIRPSKLAGSAFMAFLLSGGSALAAPPPGANTNQAQLKRYLVFNDALLSKAASKGAQIVQKTRGLTAILCSPAAAQSLGLIEDIPVQAADSAINSAVAATPVQALGLTGRGRKIVVLDTGYNYNHPELRSSYLGGKDFVNHDDDPFDDNGHGSHVAGIITGDGIDPRARGIAPEAGIIAGKVLDAGGNGFISDLVAGIHWAVDGPDGIFGTADDFQADAINISIGASEGYIYLSTFCDAAVPALTAAIKYAIDRGVTVVVAAGNNGVNGVSLPGCISYSTTVGAITRSNVLAVFSGIGPSVDLVAPGVGLYSASLGSNYKSMDGTSQAAPVVTGSIALFKEAFPNASVDDIIKRGLFPSAVDLGWVGKDNHYGWGRIDAYEALRILTANLASVVLSVTSSSNQIVCSWPAMPPGFVLQACPDMSGWLRVTNQSKLVDGQNTTVLPKSGAAQFYRLKWQ